MFSRFTRHNGEHSFFVRTDRIISINDAENGGCSIAWDAGETTGHLTVDGTATENYARLLQEELEAIKFAQREQERMQSVQRGRVLR